MVVGRKIIKSISVKNDTLEKILHHKLTQEFSPATLVIIDESHKHAGHNPDARNGGTHFCIKIASSKFRDLSRLQQHQWVYRVLDDEIKASIHALSLKLSVPD